ncbi:MAG: sulfur carrier protein ThiS [Phycisphaeraceae bacterium]|nr:sulfur carrier protein ThiS [Phycisphaeraceae bacterium]
MRIKVNGYERQMPPGASIELLLEQLKLRPDQVAVEVNRRLVRTEAYGRALSDGDQVEIVTFVGGG